VVADTPAIPELRDGGNGTIDCWQLVSFFGCVFYFAYKEINLCGLEAGDGDVKIKLDRQFLKFEC